MTAPADIAQWRNEERTRLIALRRAMALDLFQSASATIMGKVADALPPSRDGLIGCYWPFRREPDCLPYMRDVLKAGGRVALPVVVGRGRPLEFRFWTEGVKMEAGVWGILHPAEGPAVTPAALVVPLVGFDEDRFRLGYGAGYYDLTLASLVPKPFTIGVGFEFSRFSTIHPQAHDVPLDIIVTEECTREFRRA